MVKYSQPPLKLPVGANVKVSQLLPAGMPNEDGVKVPLAEEMDALTL